MLNPPISSTLQTLHSVLQASLDSTPERVSVYFKTGAGEYAEHDQFMGIRAPTLRTIAEAFSSLVLEDLASLLGSRFNEERLLALMILTSQYASAPAQHQETLYQFYTAHMGRINNWNLVDSSAHLIVGAHLYDRDRGILETLAGSQTMWERRIAVVATWHFIRRNDLAWTFKIAKQLLNDPHDLIHKAAGWMLREAGKRDSEQLVQFLDEQQHSMPRTMLRYAIERFPEEVRKSYVRRAKG